MPAVAQVGWRHLLKEMEITSFKRAVADRSVSALEGQIVCIALKRAGLTKERLRLSWPWETAQVAWQASRAR
jgi:hypothetical protein